MKKSFTVSSYSAENLFKIKKRLNNLIVPEDYIIVSFNIVAMFLFLPHTLIIKTIEKRWNPLWNHANIHCNEFFDRIKFLLNSIYFKFDNRFYKQNLESLIGSCSSSIFSEIVLFDSESQVLKFIGSDVFYITQDIWITVLKY